MKLDEILSKVYNDAMISEEKIAKSEVITTPNDNELEYTCWIVGEYHFWSRTAYIAKKREYTFQNDVFKIPFEIGKKPLPKNHIITNYYDWFEMFEEHRFIPFLPPYKTIEKVFKDVNGFDLKLEIPPNLFCFLPKAEEVLKIAKVEYFEKLESLLIEEKERRLREKDMEKNPLKYLSEEELQIYKSLEFQEKIIPIIKDGVSKLCYSKVGKKPDYNIHTGIGLQSFLYKRIDNKFKDWGFLKKISMNICNLFNQNNENNL